MLDIRGTADGSDGGFYTGQIFVAQADPVPVPASLPLLLSGGVAGWVWSRRCRSQLSSGLSEA